MLVVTHRPSKCGWEFNGDGGIVEGGARNLDESIDSAEHAARHYFTSRMGYPVPLEEAKRRVDHVVVAVTDAPEPVPAGR